MRPDEWLRARTFSGPGADPERLAASLAERGLAVSVVIPALEVAGTIGGIVEGVRERWVDGVPLVSELVVIDSRSSDETARHAAEAGATVVQDDEVLPEAGPGSGKGEAMWKSLACTGGDIVVWLDGDTHGFRPDYVPRLLEPLLADPAISYVKGFYHRPLGASGLGGARVTEICARPLLNLFYPALAALAQPLAGEAAGRRELLERLPFFTGYGVETGLVIDILRARGLSAMAQVDLGERRQDHQSTAALGRMAYAILQVVMRRLADEGRAPADLALAGPYLQPTTGDGAPDLRASEVPLAERPPMVEARHRVSR
jgi:glucosyl-3-phosphoglycerate synthase